MKFIVLMFPFLFACGQEQVKDDPTPTPPEIVGQVSVDASTAPRYLVTITDPSGNIVNASYGDEVFEGSDIETITHELENQEHVASIETLEDDSDLDSSTSSYNIYNNRRVFQGDPNRGRPNPVPLPTTYRNNNYRSTARDTNYYTAARPARHMFSYARGTFHWRPYSTYRGYAYPYRPNARSYYYNGYYVRRYYRTYW